jgi:hypothetical protein
MEFFIQQVFSRLAAGQHKIRLEVWEYYDHRNFSYCHSTKYTSETCEIENNELVEPHPSPEQLQRVRMGGDTFIVEVTPEYASSLGDALDLKPEEDLAPGDDGEEMKSIVKDNLKHEGREPDAVTIVKEPRIMSSTVTPKDKRQYSFRYFYYQAMWLNPDDSDGEAEGFLQRWAMASGDFNNYGEDNDWQKAPRSLLQGSSLKEGPCKNKYILPLC